MQNVKVLEQTPIFKVLVIGEPSVGKTSLIRRFTSRPFIENYKCTIGVDFILHNTEYNYHQVDIQFWDIAGQEHSRTLSRSFARYASAIFFVFDLTRPKTLATFDEWSQYFYIPQQDRKVDIPIIVLANKIDMYNTNTLPKWHPIFKFIKERDLPTIKTSAKSGAGLDLAKETMLGMLFKNREKLEIKRDIPMPMEPVGSCHC